MTIADALDTPDERQVLAQVWPQVEKLSVDYAIMEGADNVAVIPIDIGWSDVGSWAALLEIIAGDEAGNVVSGPHLGLDTGHSLIHGDERLIVTIGLDDMIVVDTEDALLICPRDRAQDVKEIVQRLRRDQRADLL
jgi:mannose-1-phosphate guanylyltransferase